MHRKQEPKRRGSTDAPVISQYPHCDSRVLHAPGECQFCDKHADWQELRFVWGISFTGYTPDRDELPCLSDKVRGLGGAHVWGGNRPL